MGPRTYDQYCPVAVALDVLGDRWTLLVVRELLLDARRYGDLQRALPGISPNLLADRLRALEGAGLVERDEAVYRLTATGRGARDVIEALARFGTGFLDVPSPGRPVRPAMAVFGTVVPFVDPVAAAGADEHYRLVVGGRPFDLAVRAGRVEALADADAGGTAADQPDAVIECDPALLVAARRGAVDLEAAAADGRLTVLGGRTAFRRFLTLFRLRPAGARRTETETR